MILSPILAAALSNPKFGQDLPPLSEEAEYLLNLSQDDKDNPRVLALIALQDPIYSGKLLSCANSSMYSHVPLVTSMEGAVRRLGVSQTYAVMLACAMTASLYKIPDLVQFRDFLLRYTLSLGLTAKRLCHWMGLSAEAYAVVELSCLLLPTGIFAGLVQDAKTKDIFDSALKAQMAANSFELFTVPGMQGFSALSGKVAALWGMDDRVVTTLADLARRQVSLESSVIVQAACQLLTLKSKSLPETPALQELQSAGLVKPFSDSFALAVML